MKNSMMTLIALATFGLGLFNPIFGGAVELAAAEPAATAENSWLTGKWEGQSNWQQKLDLRVVDQTKIRGDFSNQSPRNGQSYSGYIRGEVSGADVTMNIIMNINGQTYPYKMKRIDDRTMIGTAYNGRLMLKKVD